MIKLLILLLIVPVMAAAQKTTPAIILRGGIIGHQQYMATATGLVSELIVFKSGLGVGVATGIEQNPMIDKTCFPLALEISTIGKVNKVAPFVSAQIGVLLGSNTTKPDYISPVESRGGFLFRGLGGVRVPVKNKFVFFQGGYGVQGISTTAGGEKRNKDYGHWMVVVGVKLPED